jgi:hypothetical protein
MIDWILFFGISPIGGEILVSTGLKRLRTAYRVSPADTLNGGNKTITGEYNYALAA